ncbi:MAG: 30S ribosomal protein S2 [Candidatus Levybacteria bacterium]|nr:30S ribosomal protein S2 [Candidatus Levybacteria bacterium]
MRDITLEELLEAGCHFGHQVTRSNPKARDYIFEARDGIHIIDLVKSKEGLEEAAVFVKSLALRPDSNLVIVGTKRQAHPVVAEVFQKAKDAGVSDGLFYVTQRWIGGLFTNFSEVSKNFKKLEDLEKKLASPEEKSKYTKKEIGDWETERQKLENLYGGIRNLKKTPDALFIIDAKLEELAIREAIKTGVTTVSIADTNSDPHIIDYPIPANDDAVGSISLILHYIIDAWIEGRKKASQKQEKVEKSTENKKPATTEIPAAAKAKAGKQKKSTGDKPLKPVKETKET